DAQIAGKVAPRPVSGCFPIHYHGVVVYAIRIMKAAKGMYQSSLAGTILAKNGPEFASIDGQVQIAAKYLAGILQGQISGLKDHLLIRENCEVITHAMLFAVVHE